MYSPFSAMCALTALVVGVGYAIYKIWTTPPQKREEDAKVEKLPEVKVEEPVRRKRGRPKGSKTLKRRYQGSEKGHKRRS